MISRTADTLLKRLQKLWQPMSVLLKKCQCFTHSAGITMGDQICPFIFAVQGWLFCQMQTGSKLNTQSTVEREEKGKEDIGMYGKFTAQT